MFKKKGFASYWGEVFHQCWTDAAAWARDNIVFAALMLFLPVCVVYFRYPGHPVDWELMETSLGCFGASLACYCVLHLVRAPWRLDHRRAEILRGATNRAEELATELKQAREEYSARRPQLRIELREVLFLESAFPQEVFALLTVSNVRPDTICTVEAYEVEISVGGQSYKSGEIVPDLSDYVATREGDRAESEELMDLAFRITHADPIRYGAPRKGWVHFSVPDAPKVLFTMMRQGTATVTVYDPFGGSAAEQKAFEWPPPRKIESTRWDGQVKWL